MEYVNILVPKHHFDELVNSGSLKEWEVKEVVFKDDFFKDDAVHYEMKKQSNNAYKRLKKYEFEQRNK